MGLDFNKVFMAFLAVALFILAVIEISGHVYGTIGGHGHDDHHYDTKTEWAKSNFPGYWEEIAEVRAADAPKEAAPDWGLLLRNADVTSGERVFKSACKSCHTIAQGDANGTGPNLYALVGSAAAKRDGFKYSGALSSSDLVWDYANLNGWLENPNKFVRGTSMSYQGVRKINQRADLVAYLASVTPEAAEFPEPLAPIEPELSEVGLSSETDAIVPNQSDLAEVITDAVSDATISEAPAQQ